MGTFADSIVGALFGKVRLELPLILFLNSDRTYHFSEIRGIVGSGSGAVHRELRNLVNAGLVSLARRANQHRYSVNTESSVCEELRCFPL